jgi:tetratricopeptide (TPR) repeat protein
MIDKQGNARIMDFGIARSLKEKGITGAGVMIGTPEYMSPEQAEGKPVDQTSDLYSLGVILYEMATGRLPFEGETALAVAMKHKGETPRNPSELNPQVPDALSRIILRCLEKDRDRRYRSAADVNSELHLIETTIPTSEKAPLRRRMGTSREVTVTFKPKKLLIPALGVVLMAAVLFVLLMNRGPGLDPGLIVVADFENMSGDESLDSLGPMAADWIRQGLNRTGIVKVVPFQMTDAGSRDLQGEDPIHSLARDTGAGIVVSGSFYVQGEDISFHSQITDVNAGKLLSSLDPVNGPLQDPGLTIESLRQKIMGTLAIVFDPRFGTILDFTGHAPPKYEAYLEYIKAMEYYSEGDMNNVAMHFDRAAEIDPTFVLAKLHAAVAYGNMRRWDKAEALRKEVEKSRDTLSKSDLNWLDWLHARIQGDNFGQLEACRRQVQLYPSSIWLNELGRYALRNHYPQEAVEALLRLDIDKEVKAGEAWHQYWGLLTYAYHMLGKHKLELKSARRGREQFPQRFETFFYELRALVGLGEIEAVQQRLDESLNLSYRGMSPGGIMGYTSNWLRYHGYKEDAIQVAKRAVDYFRSRTDRDMRRSIALALYSAEKWDESKALYEQLALEDPDRIDYQGNLGAIAARLGDREEALRVIDILRTMERPYIFGNHTYWQACIAALLGEKERAMILLKEAMSQGIDYSRLIPDMDLESLWDYPAFIELMKPKG